MPQFTRDELYELVWERPISQLAEELGISDVAIHKACRRRNIPTPGLGYWAKVQAGQKPPITPLPEYTGPYNGWVSFRSNGVKRLSTSTREAIKAIKNQQPAYALPAPDAPLHATALRLQKRLEHARVDKDGLITIEAAGLPALILSPACKERAVILFNALLIEMERQGGKIEAGEKALQFRIQGEVISFKITEKRDRILHTPTEKEKAALETWKKECAAKRKRNEYIYEWGKPKIPQYDTPLSGKLQINLDEGYHWDNLRRIFGDGKQQQLEKLIPDIVLAAITIAASKRDERLKKEEELRQHKERERLFEIEQRSRALEQKRLDHLMKDMAEWDKAQKIRNYIAVVEARLSESTDHAAVQEWISWARSCADMIDPLEKSLPTLLQQKSEQDTQAEKWMSL